MIRVNRNKGFTIVELLIVIVTVGILAAITIVAYSAVQARATDTRMRAGADRVEKAIYSWALEASQRPRGGWSSTVGLTNGNCVDGAGGFIYAGAYSCSLEDILVTANKLPSGFTASMPPNTTLSATNGVWSIMFYPCGTNGEYALWYHLLRPTTADSNSMAAVEGAGCPTFPRTDYGMKAAKLLKL